MTNKGERPISRRFELSDRPPAAVVVAHSGVGESYEDWTPDGYQFYREHGFWRTSRPYDPVRTQARLRDITQQVSDARELVAGGANAFFSATFEGTMRRRTAERIVEMIAEAGAKLHSDFKLATPAPWKQIYGMRTILVHHYDESDPDELWEAITVNIPELARRLRLPQDANDPIPLPDIPRTA